MEKLTPKQERFANNVVAGMSLIDSYCAAFGVDKTDVVVNGRALNLSKHAGVAARIAELRGEAVMRASYTLDDHLYRLGRLRDASERLGQMSAAIKAEEQIGKALGFYVAKTELTGANGGPLEIRLVKQIIDTDLI